MTAFNIFKKPAAKKPRKKAVKVEAQPETTIEVVSAPSRVSTGMNSVILNTYVSEKASRLEGMNQYVFKVLRTANKPEVKKAIENRFKVSVTRVHMVNMPSKKRTVGRHIGTKSGFRKAIVTLAEGDSINSAKA